MTKTKTNQDLWINSLGEVGRGEELVRYPSSDQVHDLFGGKPPTADQVEALWDVIIRSFLRPNEVVLYDKWKEATSRDVLGPEGSVLFTTARGDDYSFSCYVHNGRVWMTSEPCMPSSAALAWAMVEAVATAVPGASLEELSVGYGLVSAPDVLDRHASLGVDITDRTAAGIRRLANELANALSYAQDLSGVDVKP